MADDSTQRAAHKFFIERLRTLAPFTTEELRQVTGWSTSALDTYCFGLWSPRSKRSLPPITPQPSKTSSSRELARPLSFRSTMSIGRRLSILQAAHAAEIFLKARIAQEHPLLIFELLPRSTQVDEPLLSLAHLFERGRTVQYQQFGRLRNTIQHFALPDNCDFSLETSRFIYGVVDPFMNQSWRLYAVDYCEDSEGNEYLIPTLVARSVVPRVARPRPRRLQ